MQKPNDLYSFKQDSSSSDEDGEERECCPICLAKFRHQDVGTPESCDHNFCLECITEWSRVRRNKNGFVQIVGKNISI